MNKSVEFSEKMQADWPKDWTEFKARVKAGKVAIPDDKLAAFDRLDKLLKGSVTGMNAPEEPKDVN